MIKFAIFMIMISNSYQIRQIKSRNLFHDQYPNTNCDLTPMKFYENTHQKLSLLNLYQMIAKENNSEREEFGEGIARVLNKNLALVLKHCQRIFNYIRRNFGDVKHLKITQMESWQKIKNELKIEKQRHSSFGVKNKIDEYDLDRFLKNLKYKPKNYLEMFKEKEKDLNDQFFKESQLDSIEELENKIKEVSDNFTNLKNKYKISYSDLKAFKFTKNINEVNEHLNKSLDEIEELVKSYSRKIKGIDLLNNKKNYIERNFLDGAKSILNIVNMSLYILDDSHESQIFDQLLSIKDKFIEAHQENKKMNKLMKEKVDLILQNKYNKEFDKFVKNGFKLND